MKKRYSSGNIFNSVEIQKFPRHHFNLGHFNKLTCNHGKAIPFLVDDVFCGDRVDCRTFGRIQLQPLATSSMQNIRCYFRYFYVPYRLVWENWDKFITQDDFDETAFKVPYVNLGGKALNTSFSPGGLSDYLGFNTNGYDETTGKLKSDYFEDTAIVSVNVFRWLAYQLIWDYYFRDENLQEPVLGSPIETNGSLSIAFVSRMDEVLPVAYEKDYFTTALPWQQKGEPVNLNAFVVQSMSEPFLINGGRDSVSLGYRYNTSSAVGDAIFVSENLPAVSSEVSLNSEGFSTSLNINDLRYSNALQRFLERKALGGSRPSEFYLSMYGVKVDDLRIGQPLYLGGGFTNVSVTDVAQSVATDESTNSGALGRLAGNGKSFPAISFNNPYYCQEFGIIMCIKLNKIIIN